MSKDISGLLDDWPHDPGSIQARLIEGEDGRQKVQVRVDLGIIQMEMDGRPDGHKPHGCESLLDYHMQRAVSQGEDYILDEDACGELHAEGLQYYHRYVSLMHLKEFDLVVRDTDRNLTLFDFVAEHANDTAIVDSFEQFRAYVIMIRTRAKASKAMEEDEFDVAQGFLEEGRSEIRQLIAGGGDPVEQVESSELQFLDVFEREMLERKPLSRRQRIEREMEIAIQQEAYELAAKLRDEIRSLDAPSGD